jgi:hypothetical protein
MGGAGVRCEVEGENGDMAAAATSPVSVGYGLWVSN